MSQTRSVAPTGRPHWFGQHGADMLSMERHRNVNDTPLMIALGLALFVFAALIWYCLSTAFRTRKRVSYADHDPEAAMANGPTYSEAVPPYTIVNAQHDPSSGQNSKKVLRSPYTRSRSVTLPHPVYDPSQHGIPPLNYGIGVRQHERSRSLSSLPSLSCPLYHTDTGSSSAVIERDPRPPPEYSSLPGSPSSPSPSPAQPITDEVARFEVGGIENGASYASLIPALFSGPDISFLRWKPAECMIKAIPTTLTRTLVSPERYTPKYTASEPSSYASRLITLPATDHHTTRLCGTYTISDDNQSGHILSRLLLPSEQTAASDSIVTISACHMIAAAGDLSGTEFLQGHSDDHDPSRAITTASASQYVASDEVSRLEVSQEPMSTQFREAGHDATAA